MFVMGVLIGSLLAAVITGSFKFQAVPDSWKKKFGGSTVKRVRELGSERRETVRSLSDVGVRILEGDFSSVREDQEKRTSGVPVVLPRAKAG